MEYYTDTKMGEPVLLAICLWMHKYLERVCQRRVHLWGSVRSFRRMVLAVTENRCARSTRGGLWELAVCQPILHFP